jgi:phenylalanyl-tRNA synthetase beta subunit
MLEYGQPLHTFDYNKIAGSKIIVRKARKMNHHLSGWGRAQADTRDAGDLRQ